MPAMADAAGISTCGAGDSLWFCELSLWCDERCWCCGSFNVVTWLPVVGALISTWDDVNWALVDCDVEGAFNWA